MPIRLDLTTNKRNFSKFQDPLVSSSLPVTPETGPFYLNGQSILTPYMRSFDGGSPSTSVFARTIDGGSV